MIDATSNAEAVQAQLLRLAGEITTSEADVLTRALDELIARLEPATPVRTGRMRAGYTADVQGDVGELGNTQEYAKYVIGGTSRQHANAALNDVLDSAERDVADTVGLELTRLVARYR